MIGPLGVLMDILTATNSFLNYCRVAKTLSPHTVRAYETDLAHMAAKLGCHIPVSSIGRDDLRAYVGGMLQEQELKATSVKRRMATVKQLFKWLEREEAIPLNPFHRLDLSIRLPRRLPRALTVEDIRKLLQRARHEAEVGGTHSAQVMHFVVIALIVTGLRVGELAGVGLSDLNEAEGVILVRGKGNRERQVYLPGATAKAALQTYLKARAGIETESDRLLISSYGTPVTPPRIRRRLSALADRAGLTRHVTPHMLRHTAATQLIEAGVDIRFVQKLLGHASIATTQIYTQVSDTSLRSTLEQADTLGRIGGQRGR